MLEFFNSLDNRIKLTYELEQNNSIDFLDLSIIRENNQLITNWHRKPTFSGKFLNYKSQHLIGHKKEVVFNLVDRAILLSDSRFHNENLRIVKELLVKNNYPEQFFKKLINKRYFYCLNKINNIPTQSDNDKQDRLDNNKKFFVLLPFVKNFYFKTSRELRKFGIITRPKIVYNLKNVIKRVKDHLESNKQVDSVYCIQCLDCNASYVRESKRQKLE